MLWAFPSYFLKLIKEWTGLQEWGAPSKGCFSKNPSGPSSPPPSTLKGLTSEWIPTQRPSITSTPKLAGNTVTSLGQDCLLTFLGAKRTELDQISGKGGQISITPSIGWVFRGCTLLALPSRTDLDPREPTYYKQSSIFSGCATIKFHFVVPVDSWITGKIQK